MYIWEGNHITASCKKFKKKSQLFWQIYNFFSNVRTCFFSLLSSFNDEKNRYKYYNKWITIRDNGNVQSHDQEETKLSNTCKTNSCFHAVTDDKIMKTPFDKNDVATIKAK